MCTNLLISVISPAAAVWCHAAASSSVHKFISGNSVSHRKSEMFISISPVISSWHQLLNPCLYIYLLNDLLQLSAQQTQPRQRKEANGSVYAQDDGASPEETVAFLLEAHAPFVERETAVWHHGFTSLQFDWQHTCVFILCFVAFASWRRP